MKPLGIRSDEFKFNLIASCVKVSGATNVYQWYLGDPDAAAPNTGTPISNGGVYNGATSATLTISDVKNLIGNTYYVVVTNPSRNECARIVRSAELLSNVVDLAITKTNTPGENGEADKTDDTVTRGQTTSYRIVVTNNGPGPVTGATVTDTATGLTCTTLTCSPPASPGPSACPASLPTAAAFTSGSSITLGTLPVDGKVTLDVGCTVN